METAGKRTASVKAVKQSLVQMFARRARALMTGDMEAVKGLFDAGSVYGQWALEHEIRRLQYVKAWTKARGIRLLNVQTDLGIRTVDFDGDVAQVFLVQTLKITYGYTREPGEAPNQFGIGTRHTMELINRKGKWLIRRDWFTDPLEEDALVHDAQPAIMPAPDATKWTQGTAEPPAAAGPARIAAGYGYDREAAVAYADKYAGLALGTKLRYNPAYRDYTNLGGDCTNYVSQVLSDSEGGKLPRDGVWAYGSRAWAQAQSLADYLLDRGYARLIGCGGFGELVRATADRPHGAVGELQAGDVIAYQEKGRVVHLSVVVGRNPQGYPLVNAHTADRYHSPWDLGWDRSTVFWLLQIRD